MFQQFLHTATMAQAAGVPEIVITTKGAEDGSVNPAILYTQQKFVVQLKFIRWAASTQLEPLLMELHQLRKLIK